MPFTGSCLCGQVRYQVSGDFGSRTICHCKNCRKASGSSFLANSFFEKRVSSSVLSLAIIQRHSCTVWEHASHVREGRSKRSVSADPVSKNSFSRSLMEPRASAPTSIRGLTLEPPLTARSAETVGLLSSARMKRNSLAESLLRQGRSMMRKVFKNGLLR